MSTLIELLNKTGLNTAQLAQQSGIDPRTLTEHAKNGTMTRSLRKKLRPLTRHFRKTLVSEVGNIILENYREHKDKHLHPDENDLLRFIEDYLIIIPRLQCADDYEWCEFQYVLAHLLYSRAFHGKWKKGVVDDGRVRNLAAKDAQKLYETVAQRVRSIDPSTLSEEQANNQSAFADLLDLNAMETKWQMAKRNLVSRSECLEELRNKDIVGRLRAALTIPHNAGVWTIPHNGLIFTSLDNRRDDMKFFHDKLVEVQPGFCSWDFTPGEVPTLREDKDLANFRQAFPNLDAKATPKETTVIKKVSTAAYILAIGTATLGLVQFTLTTLALAASNM